MKKGVLGNFAKFTGKPLCRPQACNFINKEILVQVFSCEFCEIFKNTFFTEHLRTTASIWGHWLTCSRLNGYSHRRLCFFQVILSEVRTG